MLFAQKYLVHAFWVDTGGDKQQQTHIGSYKLNLSRGQLNYKCLKTLAQGVQDSSKVPYVDDQNKF